jgi:C4-dicarboxylate-specific signal transduction histidine kinase
MSIRIKLTLLIGGVILGITAATSLYTVRENQNIWTSHFKVGLEEKLDYSIVLTNLFFGRIQDSILGLSRDSDVVAGLASNDPDTGTKVNDKLQQLLQTVTTIEGISLHSIENGKCIVKYADNASQSLVGKDVSERDYCKGVLATKLPYISGVFTSLVSDHPAIGIAAPILNLQGEVTGYVVGLVSLNELRGYLWDLQKENNFIIIYDRYGAGLINTLADAKEYEARLQDLSELSNGSKESGYIESADYLYGFRKLNEFMIILGEPKVNIQTSVSQANRTLVLSSSISGIVLLLLVYFSISSVTGRLIKITRVAEDISRDTKNISIDPKLLASTDEVGTLSKSMNSMMGSIRTSQENLEKKVEERTKDLERTKDELERMNSFMVDRELKLTEMKKEMYETQK